VLDPGAFDPAKTYVAIINSDGDNIAFDEVRDTAHRPPPTAHRYPCIHRLPPTGASRCVGPGAVGV
jgi:hypothetical protein